MFQVDGYHLHTFFPGQAPGYAKRRCRKGTSCRAGSRSSDSAFWFSRAESGALLPVRGRAVQHPVAYGHGPGVCRHRRGEGPEVVEVVRAPVPDAPGHPDGDRGHSAVDQLAVKKGEYCT